MSLSAIFCLNLYAAEDRTNDFTIFTDLLVWCANESGTENWAQIFSTNSVDILAVSFGCDVGFRLGIDYNIKYDAWDTQLYYTWFRTVGTDHASTTDIIGSSFLGNFYIGNADGSSDAGALYRKASIKWTILFNMFDWELGRRYQVSSALSLRPFLGLKGGWIHQNIRSKWQNPTTGTFNSATENLKNNFWGIGPSGGLNTKWKLGHIDKHTFSLFGDFSAALLWGRWRLKDVYKNDQPEKVSVSLPKITGGATMLRTFMGFVWDAALKERFTFSIRLGYEAQFWFNQLRFYSFNAGRLNNELTLQGGTIDFNFNF